MGWFGSRRRQEAEKDFLERVFVHWEAMYRYALRLTGSDIEARDLVQEAMMKALQHFDRVRPDTNFKAWTFTIVRNAFVSKLRKSGRELAVEDVGIYMEPHNDSPADSFHPLREQDFHEHFEDEVLAALQELPEVQRTALVLCDIEGLEYEAIAEVLSCPLGTVRSRIHHARKRLKSALAGYAAQRGYSDVSRHG